MAQLPRSPLDWPKEVKTAAKIRTKRLIMKAKSDALNQVRQEYESRPECAPEPEQRTQKRHGQQSSIFKF